MELAAGATTWPRANQVTSRNDRVAMLLMVVLAQEDRPRIGDHLHLCLSDAASVTRNPEVLAHAGRVVLHNPGGAPRLGEVVPEDSHRQSLQRLRSDPFLNLAGQVRSCCASTGCCLGGAQGAGESGRDDQVAGGQVVDGGAAEPEQG
jgi:hypothetical protein